MKKEISLSIVFNIFTILIALGFISYLTKNLSVEDFGKYQLVITFIGVIGIFSLSGLNMIINKNILNGKDYIFQNTFWKTYKNVIKIFLLLLFIFMFLGLYFNNEKIYLFIIAILFLPLLGLEKYESILYAKQKFIKIRILTLINVFVYVVFSIILLEYTNNYLYIFACMFIIKAIIIYIGLKYSISLLDKNFANIDSTQELIEGYKLSLLSLYSVGIGYLDKLILGLMDVGLLAIYAIGILIPLRVKDQLKMVLNILIQNWAKNGEINYIKNVKKYNKYIFISTAILSLSISSAASFYIPIIFSDEYLESEIIIWIISISIPFILSATIFESYIVIFHNTSFYQKVTYSKQIIYLLALIILVPTLNITGVAIAFLTRSIYDCSINYIYFHKYQNKVVLV